jgi:PII-like signaling protein
MSGAGDGLKLTVHLGDRDHSGGRLLADEVMDVFAARRIAASALVRGVEGFGIKHRLHTERLLTLSEDLPLLAVALDAPEAIEAAVAELQALGLHGLLTLERVRMPSRGADPAAESGAGTMLTVVLGRRRRIEGRPAHLAAVDCLRRHGLDGATTLLGLDGTLAGERRRASFSPAVPRRASRRQRPSSPDCSPGRRWRSSASRCASATASCSRRRRCRRRPRAAGTPTGRS